MSLRVSWQGKGWGGSAILRQGALKSSSLGTPSVC